MTDKVEKHSHTELTINMVLLLVLYVFLEHVNTGHRKQDVHNGNNKEAIIQQYLQL